MTALKEPLVKQEFGCSLFMRQPFEYSKVSFSEILRLNVVIDESRGRAKKSLSQRDLTSGLKEFFR
jgi:hypothetical protein